jgi:hypothetical protein
MDKLQWEAATYQSPKSAQVADINGHRLYVKRTAPRSRLFVGYIDGRSVGSWDTLEMAMSQTAKIFRETGGL